jgi:NAD(P)-dependent dehydrogenase (short-subunit alcohol dehydrogenase family)
MAQSLVIVGAGKGLGFSLAKAFGARGWRAALVARRKLELHRLCAELKKLKVDALPYPCDVGEEQQVEKVFDYIKKDLGRIDALYFGPAPARALTKYDASKATPKSLVEPWKTLVAGAVSVTRAVLPDMLERKAGALIFTTCAASLRPAPDSAPAAAAMAGLRGYALSLNAELAPKGVYAAHVSIGVEITPGGEGDPDRLAAGFAALMEGRQLPEAVIAPSAGPAALAPPSKE